MTTGKFNMHPGETGETPEPLEPHKYGEASPLEDIATPLAPAQEAPFEVHRTMHYPEAELKLETYAPEKETNLGGGFNTTVLIKLKDDGSGVHKPRAGETHLRDAVREGTYYLRERAAYLVDLFFEFGLVPPTTIREIDGQVGSFQQFIEDAATGWERSDEIKNEKIRHGLMKLWIFDYIIYNSDRHGGNFLIKDDAVYAIDNGLSFGSDELHFNQAFFGEEIPEDIREKIISFLGNSAKQSELRNLLKELISETEVDACFKRIENIGRLLDTETRGTILHEKELNYHGVKETVNVPGKPEEAAAPEERSYNIEDTGKFVEIHKLYKDHSQRLLVTAKIGPTGDVEFEGNSTFIENLKKNGIIDHKHPGGRKLMPEDGVKFLEELQTAFKSGYLNASEVKEK